MTRTIEKYPFTIGGISLDDAFEGPDGNQGGLSDLGSKQKAVVREFAGGIVTAQLYGSFPKVIHWAGKLIGANARARSLELQGLADNRGQVNFNWADWNYDGFVEDYKATAKGPHLIEYEITFRPIYNNTTSSGGYLANNDPFAGTVSNAQRTMEQQSQSPSSGIVLAGSIQNDVTSLNQSINQALQGNGGAVSTLPEPTLQTLQGQISTIQNALNPIINGNDPAKASSAADLSATLSVLQTAFSNTLKQVITTVRAVNPNLYELAVQFYGDASLYQIISDANNYLDPLSDDGTDIDVVIPLRKNLVDSDLVTVVYGKAS